MDPHHVDVDLGADPDSTYHPDADPDLDPDPSFQIKAQTSVPGPDPHPDPDPSDPHVFGPPGSGSFYQPAKIVRKTLILTVL